MDINLYIEGLRQSQEKTSRQKDILDTWEEIQKVPFDRQTAIKQAKKNKLNYSNLREKTSPMFVIGTRPWEELYLRSKISRNYWLFEPKCRNNAEITYTQRLQIASYFP